MKNFTLNYHSKNLEGIAFRNLKLKKTLLAHFSNVGNATISELSSSLNFSSPKITEVINDLISEGLVKDYGKVESGVGRRPKSYGLNPNSLFFVGVDVKRDYINIGILNFNKEIISIEEKIPFPLQNNQKSLDILCSLINEFIKKQKNKDKIAGIGINLTGRIDSNKGYSYSYFNFEEDPLSEVLEKRFKIAVFIENDSRAKAYGEFSNGVVEKEKNVIFVNIDYGVGTGVMIDGKLYHGKSGFAGELGHIPIFDNDVICQCGKIGCLETEASGHALTKLFRKKIKEGSSSILTKKYKNPDDIKLDDVIWAAKNDDVLAIELIAQIGEKLGQGIAILINLFNPELVVLGGSLAETDAYIRLPIISSIHKYSLSLVNNDTDLKMSVLKEKAGVVGACLLVRDRLLN